MPLPLNDFLYRICSLCVAICCYRSAFRLFSFFYAFFYSFIVLLSFVIFWWSCVVVPLPVALPFYRCRYLFVVESFVESFVVASFESFILLSFIVISFIIGFASFVFCIFFCSMLSYGARYLTLRWLLLPLFYGCWLCAGLPSRYTFVALCKTDGGCGWLYFCTFVCALFCAFALLYHRLVAVVVRAAVERGVTAPRCLLVRANVTVYCSFALRSYLPYARSFMLLPVDCPLVDYYTALPRVALRYPCNCRCITSRCTCQLFVLLLLQLLLLIRSLVVCVVTVVPVIGFDFSDFVTFCFNVTATCYMYCFWITIYYHTTYLCRYCRLIIATFTLPLLPPCVASYYYFYCAPVSCCYCSKHYHVIALPVTYYSCLGLLGRYYLGLMPDVAALYLLFTAAAMIMLSLTYFLRSRWLRSDWIILRWRCLIALVFAFWMPCVAFYFSVVVVGGWWIPITFYRFLAGCFNVGCVLPGFALLCCYYHGLPSLGCMPCRAMPVAVVCLHCAFMVHAFVTPLNAVDHAHWLRLVTLLTLPCNVALLPR